MLTRLGTLIPRISERGSLSILLSAYPEGIHAVGDIFFRKTSGNNVAFVISLICDHAGAKFILRNDLGCAVCPMHGWRLDLDTLSYLNLPENKRMLPFEVKAGVLHVDLPEFSIELPSAGPPAPACGTSAAERRPGRAGERRVTRRRRLSRFSRVRSLLAGRQRDDM